MTEFVDDGAVIDTWGSHEFNRAFGTYTVACIKEDDPDRAEVVEIVSRIQGQDYVRSGYIEPEKLDDQGRLLDPNDSKRIVTHFAAYPIGTGFQSIEGSVKVHQVPEGSDLDVLAAYQYSKDSLFPDYRARIETSFEREPKRGVVEVGGLTRVDHPMSKLVPYELIRELMQQAVRAKTNEKWLITFTEKAFAPITASFGPEVICVAGDRVRIEEEDEHVTLVPCLIEPCALIDNMISSIETTDDPTLWRHRVEVFILMTDGLLPEELSNRARELVVALTEETVA